MTELQKIVFAVKTPVAVQRWLRDKFDGAGYGGGVRRKLDPIVLALATDDRMADLYEELRGWPGAATIELLESACFARQDHILDQMISHPVGTRGALPSPADEIALMALQLSE